MSEAMILTQLGRKRLAAIIAGTTAFDIAYVAVGTGGTVALGNVNPGAGVTGNNGTATSFGAFISCPGGGCILGSGGAGNTGPGAR